MHSKNLQNVFCIEARSVVFVLHIIHNRKGLILSVIRFGSLNIALSYCVNIHCLPGSWKADGQGKGPASLVLCNTSRSEPVSLIGSCSSQYREVKCKGILSTLERILG